VKNILYNEHGQRTEIDYGNNVVTKYAYDDENLRLKTIETTKGGRTIQSLTYDYDDTGNVTRRSNDGFQTKDDNRKFAEHNYEYDSLNRLVKAKGSYTRSGLIIDNMLQKYDTKYDYTPGGNISRKKQSAWGVGTEGNSITDVNLSYDNEYKYDSPKPHAVTKVGSTEYTYDLDGRMTGSYDSESKFKRTFTWDEEGRLLKTVDNKHTTDYRYDANGERICKYSDLGETIYASGYYTETDGKKISKHIYIGSTRVASQVMSRSCETSTTMKRENTLYYHTDHLGSSGYVTDKKGEFYEHTEYTSSGESWVNEKVTGNANLPYKYTSKEMDAETGLYYYGARYYDARTSRWISTDPILESYLAGEPNEGIYDSSNLNLYSYVSNKPIRKNDPTGMWGKDVHLGDSTLWAEEAGIDSKRAKRIAEACVGVDSFFGGKAPIPILGDQSYHFNTNKPGEVDSRIIKSQLHFNRAVKLQKWANEYRNSDGGFIGGIKNIIADILEYWVDDNLGKGLHPLQDIRAHSDDLVGESSTLFGLIKWKYHDNYGPKVKYDYPFADDKKERKIEHFETRSDTIKFLKDFKEKTKK